MWTHPFRSLALFALFGLFGLVSAVLPAPLHAQRPDDSSSTTERTVTRVADGVYVIRHPDAPDEFPQGNTTVVIGEQAVLVVDSGYLPSTAREDIAQIRQWTDQPVRYLVNTHWHNDHVTGNRAYGEAFPDIAIIAHAATARHTGGYVPGYLTRYPGRADRFRAIVASGTNPDGTPVTDEDRAIYDKVIAGTSSVGPEYEDLTLLLPNVTFDHEMTLDLGGREVQLKHLGRGNTSGDVIAWLPAEQIVVAGDLLGHPVPYLGGGYPVDLVETLQKMAWLEPEIIVPGHGTVLRGDYARSYLALVTDFVDRVTQQVSQEVYRIGNGPRNLDAVREAVTAAIDFDEWTRKIAGDDPKDQEFFKSFSVQGVVTAAYAQTWGR